MNAGTDAEDLEWFVGPPTGIHTRVCYDDPSGTHPLTPDSVRGRYTEEVCNSALVVWHSSDLGLGGVRAGIDEVAWRDADLAHFETVFCRPGKGSGYVWLAARLHSGQKRFILSSTHYDGTIMEWHLAVATQLEGIYPGLTRMCDYDCDA